jgi:prolyl 4-hydroxylase
MFCQQWSMTNPFRRHLFIRSRRSVINTTVRCANNKPRVHKNVLTEEECNECVYLANKYKENTVINLTSTLNGGTLVKSDDQFMKVVDTKLNDIIKTKYNRESNSFCHMNVYEPYEKFVLHVDALYASQIENYGPQRIASALVYLNDIENGGETVFPCHDISIVPKRGTMVYWENVLDGGSINFDMTHFTTESPEVKYVLVKMFHRIV